MLTHVLRSTDSSEIVDLCSGSTGPVLHLHELIVESGARPVQITLTDKFPNPDIGNELEARYQAVRYLTESVDATNVPRELQGVRTLFTSFHHFPPEVAVKMLEDAAAKRAPIAVVEFTERTFANLAKAALLSPFLVWLTTPFIRPWSIRRLFWTYVLPVVPITYTWDAVASHWRTYSVEELRRLTASVPVADYEWTFGKVPSRPSGFNITYLFGVPIAEADTPA
jgi:hypothetical protein